MLARFHFVSLTFAFRSMDHTHGVSLANNLKPGLRSALSYLETLRLRLT
jgi:hypothetical protein